MNRASLSVHTRSFFSLIYWWPSIIGTFAFLIAHIFDIFRTKISQKRLFVFLAFCCYVFFILLFKPPHLDFIRSNLNGLAFLIFYVLLPGNTVGNNLKSVFKVLILSSSLLFLLANAIGVDAFFSNNLGGARFQSYMLEPSILGIITVWSMVPFLREKSKNSLFYIFLGAVIVVSTASGSAYVLLMISVLLFVPTRYLPAIGIGLLAAGAIIYLSIREAFDLLVVSRFDRILLGDYSNSVLLRFVAPWQALGVLMENDVWSFVFGVGLGNMEPYLEANKMSYPFLVNYLGNFRPVLNNGIAVIIFSFGLLGFSMIFSLMAVMAYKMRRHKEAVLLWMTCFATAHIFSPILAMAYLVTFTKSKKYV